jgi:putative FmdB family regulatory protein
MIYVYKCDGCEKNFDIVKSVSDFDREELCPTSGVTMTRQFTPAKIYLGKTSVEDSYYHPAFGQVVSGDSHAQKLAKERGWVEVGNEKVEQHVKPPESSYDDV